MKENTANTIKAAREYFGNKEFTSTDWDYPFTVWYHKHVTKDFNPAYIRTVRKYANVEVRSEWVDCGDEWEDYAEEIRYYRFV